jgi:hypothetical protein
VNELARLRAERHLDTLISYLFRERTVIVESTRKACERYTDSVNAFFDAETFSVCSGSQDSFRIECECGWSLMLPARSTANASQAVLHQCLRRMVLHFETRHGGVRERGIPQ